MSTKEIVVDMRGQLCPEPVIQAKKAMEEDSTAFVKVIVDNDVSRDNVVKLGAYKGYETHVVQDEKNYVIMLIPKEEIAPTEEAEEQDVTASSILAAFKKNKGKSHAEVMDEIIEKDHNRSVSEAITNPSITGGSPYFYMSVGCGSLDRSTEAYEAMKSDPEDNLLASLDDETAAYLGVKPEDLAKARGAEAAQAALADSAASPAPSKTGGKVLLMTKDYLGESNQELGRNLMKTFFYCLTEADVKPKAIYFINSAVLMVGPNSPHLENLKALEAAGVEIAACGICLDFYRLKEEVQVGSITNLYAITDAMMQESMVTL